MPAHNVGGWFAQARVRQAATAQSAASNNLKWWQPQVNVCRHAILADRLVGDLLVRFSRPQLCTYSSIRNSRAWVKQVDKGIVSAVECPRSVLRQDKTRLVG